ncbi:immunoglobulin-like domain-containing protein [Mariniflexile sp.]|uniref:HYR-like domain-containing protein n=1 Tax=Mariniflexile sp. TaxID=1979402 RepID=UPI00356B1A72
MKQLYFKKTFVNKLSIKLMLFAFLFVGISISYSQAPRVPFTPRSSSETPTKTNYNIKGDFTMIGNTNLKLAGYTYPTSQSNWNDMEYVDIDNDDSTLNSSSAFLTFSTENGAIPDCSKIIYAGLYWTGRAFGDNQTDTETFTVTKQISTGATVTKSYNKRKVSIKGPLASTYTEVTASGIAFPTNGEDRNMYSAYADVTSYVRQNGIGNYFVADIALREGNPDGTGFYGGWGLVVVYENSKMKWRDITVFDGHAYVPTGIASRTLDVTGFNAVQNGNVNLKLGVMAGEGDIAYAGDYFRMLRQDLNVYEPLAHSNNSAVNFFNSSIVTGGNARNPNYANNTGLDIAMFDVENTNNKFITNNQTSTSFNFGTTQDTYIIFNITFSVDAYIPEPNGLLTTASGNVNPLSPGDSENFKLEIRNQGTEATNNTIVTLPLPQYLMEGSDLNITTFVHDSVTTAGVPVINEPNATYPFGYITWDLGTLPLPADPSTLLAEIKLTLTVTTNCSALISDPEQKELKLYGFFSGEGAISGQTFDNIPFIYGYESDPPCTGEPITEPFVVQIDYQDFVNQPPTASNPSPITVQCLSEVPEPDVLVVTDEADNSGIAPTVTFISDVSDGNSNPEIITRTYRVTDDCNNSIDVTQTITIDDATAPVITLIGANPQILESCDSYVELGANVSDCESGLTVTINDTNVNMNIPGNYTVTYNVTDSAGNSATEVTRTVTVQDTTAPVITLIGANPQILESCDSYVELGANVSDCESGLTVTINDSDVNMNIPGNYTVTYNVTDSAGNSATEVTRNVTVQDTTAPVITLIGANPQILESCDSYVELGANVSDCESGLTVTINDSDVNMNIPGNYTVTYNVSDSAGNSATEVTRTVTVQDTTAPVITLIGANPQILESCDSYVELGATVSDCESGLTVTINDSDVNMNIPGNYTVTYNVTDSAGNSATEVTRTVTVQDTTAPVIDNTNTANIEIECGVGDTETALTNWLNNNAGATATDSCSSVTWSNNYGDDDTVKCDNGAITVTFTARDPYGNFATTTATYLIKDTDNPTITTSASNLTVECDGAGNIGDLNTWLSNNGGALASDSCSTVTWSNNFTTLSDDCGETGSATVIFTATDACGNTTSTSAVFTITDTTNPIIDVPQDVTVECISDTSSVNTGVATATDSCGNVTITQSDSSQAGSCGNTVIITRTWTATDECGNSTSADQIITTQDTTAPTLIIPANATVECTADTSSAATGVATATDACGNVTITQSDSSQAGSCGNTVIITRTWTATDECGNAASADQIITTQDTIAPIIDNTNTANIEIECGIGNTETALTNWLMNNAGATATDSCGDVTWTNNYGSDDSVKCDNGAITVVFTARDACGNTSTTTATYLVKDNTPPTVNTIPGSLDATLECSDTTGISDALGLVPTASDDCSTAALILVSDVTTADDNCASAYVRIRTWNFADGCGNTSETFTQTIVVQDTTAPIITTAPGSLDTTLECSDDSGITNALALFPMATDNCNATPNLALVSDITTTVVNCANSYVRVRTWNYTDGCGNTSSEFTQTITIQDTTAPIITSVAGSLDTTLECSDTSGMATALALSPVATDNCSTTPNLVLVNDVTTADPNCGNAYIRTRTWNFTDSCGNTSSEFTQTITVEDNTAPVIDNTNITNLEVECGVDDTQTALTNWLTNNAGATATDNCGNVTWTNNYGADDSVKCDNGAITITFIARDECGNISSTTASYLIKDTDAPIIATQASNLTVECDGSGNLGDLNTWLSNNGGAEASDACSNITWSNNFTELTNNCGLTGSALVTFTARDACGNTSSTTATFTIVDETAPTAPNAPENITYQCIADVPAAGSLTANDICGGEITAVGTDEIDNSDLCKITITRKWSFTDECGNTSEISQTITVEDTTAPVLSLPANVTAECSNDLSPLAFGTATATDNCDTNPTVSYTDNITEGACSGTYTITRTWTATDTCGNTATANQIISTSDTTAPEFVETTLPANIIVECNTIPEPEMLTATDNCGTAEVTVTDVRTDGSCEYNYTITRTYTATDECGLTKTHIQTITVQDITPPVFVESLPVSNLVVECDAVPTAEILTATDNCGSATVTVTDVKSNGNCGNNYTLARTWTATNLCGLTTTHTQVITVRDTKAPTFDQIDLPANMTVACDEVPVTETLTATDNCGDAIVTVSEVRTNGSCPNNYIVIRTWTATDECGLTTTHTQIITVEDNEAPQPTTNFETELNVSCTNIPEAPELTFTDNCSSSSNISIVFNETNTYVEGVYNDYEIVRTWVVKDECNNEAEYKQTLYVTLDEIISDIVADDRCFDDGIINLNDLISGTINTNGTWELIEGNPAATLTGSIFNPTLLELSEDFLPQDGGMDYVFRYTTTDNGCITITNVTMNINADCVVLPCGENDVVISKAVTPNEDFINDFFYISGIDLCGFVADVKIFNRWGALVFDSENYPLVNSVEIKSTPPANAWTGNASKKSVGNAGKLPNGTYYYIVTLKDSGLAPFTGPVYLGTK